MAWFGKSDPKQEQPKPKPPARVEEKPKAPAPSLKNTIDAIKQRKKMLDEI